MIFSEYEVREIGWEQIREKYLTNSDNFKDMRIKICEGKCCCDCHN